MKKLFLYVVALFIGALSAQAQITFTRSDYGSIGDKVRYATDTNVTSQSIIGTPGTNETWDLRGVMHAHQLDSSEFMDPSTFPNAPVNANIALVDGNGNPEFQLVTDSSISLLIDEPDFGVTGISMKISTLPLTYLTATSDSSLISIKGTLADFGISPIPGFDSLRIDVKIKTTSLCDAWGNIILPDSSSHDCLRVKINTSQKISAFMRNTLTGSWFTAPFSIPNQPGTEQYAWFGTNSKNYLAEASLDTLGNIATMTYAVQELPKIGHLVSISPAYGYQGQYTSVTLEGANTFFTQINISDSARITFSNADTMFMSDFLYPGWSNNFIGSSVFIDGSTPTGLYDVWINDPVSGAIMLYNGFEVLDSTLIPRALGINPNTGSQGSTMDVIISGKNTHFSQGNTSVYFYPTTTSAGSITVTSYLPLTDSTLKCTITIDANTALTTFDVSIYSATDGSMYLPGAFTVTQAVGINEVAISDADVTVFPNPANDVLTITCDKEVPTSVTLFDLTGRAVKTIAVNAHSNRIDVSDMSNGVYFCIVSGNDFAVSKKVVITKN